MRGVGKCFVLGHWVAHQQPVRLGEAGLSRAPPTAVTSPTALSLRWPRRLCEACLGHFSLVENSGIAVLCPGRVCGDTRSLRSDSTCVKFLNLHSFGFVSQRFTHGDTVLYSCALVLDFYVDALGSSMFLAALWLMPECIGRYGRGQGIDSMAGRGPATLLSREQGRGGSWKCCAILVQ